MKSHTVKEKIIPRHRINPLEKPAFIILMINFAPQ